ncbi:uncharacterized protein LOC122463938 isoform X4 [Chelonia mydas]|nr:uncharacterized protein LOC122463938 isoform X4 [Chelonia mydas]
MHMHAVNTHMLHAHALHTLTAGTHTEHTTHTLTHALRAHCIHCTLHAHTDAHTAHTLHRRTLCTHCIHCTLHSPHAYARSEYTHAACTRTAHTHCTHARTLNTPRTHCTLTARTHCIYAHCSCTRAHSAGAHCTLPCTAHSLHTHTVLTACYAHCPLTHGRWTLLTDPWTLHTDCRNTAHCMGTARVYFTRTAQRCATLRVPTARSLLTHCTGTHGALPVHTTQPSPGTWTQPSPRTPAHTPTAQSLRPHEGPRGGGLPQRAGSKPCHAGLTRAGRRGGGDPRGTCPSPAHPGVPDLWHPDTLRGRGAGGGGRLSPAQPP